jgi:hypothetical protein
LNLNFVSEFADLSVKLDEFDENGSDFKIWTQPKLLNFNKFHRIC